MSLTQMKFHPTLARGLIVALAALTAPARSKGTEAGPLAYPPQIKVIANDPRVGLTMGPPTVVMPHGGYQPYLFCTSHGTLFCQAQLEAEPFRTKPGRVYHMRIGTAMSRDGGRTWQPWTFQAGHDDVFIEGGALECSDGTILLLDTFVMKEKRPDHGVGEIWKSTDDLRTLHGPTHPDFFLSQIQWIGTDDRPDIVRDYARLHRSVIEMPNGDLLALMYSQFVADNAPSAYLATMFKSRNVLMRSQDHGASWRYFSTVAVDGAVGTEGFDEGALVRVSQGKHQGRLLCVMRTGRELYGTHSDDGGVTWVRARPVAIPGVDIYDTAKWENRFVKKADPNYMPTDEMYGNMVDPDLIEMRDGTLVCAVGVRVPARKSLFQDWRSPENGDYLLFSLDGGDTWSHVVQYLSGAPTTHYSGVREVTPGHLYVVYDNSIWRQHAKAGNEPATIGFALTVRRSP